MTAPRRNHKHATIAALAGTATITAAIGGILYLENNARNNERDLAWEMCQQRIKTDTGYRDFTFAEPTEEHDNNQYRFAGNVDIGSGYTFGEYRYSCTIDPAGRALDDEVSISPR